MKNGKENKEATTNIPLEDKKKGCDNTKESKTNELLEEKTKKKQEEKQNDLMVEKEKTEGQTDKKTEKHTDNSPNEEPIENAKEKAAENVEEKTAEKKATTAPPSLDELTETACNMLKNNKEMNEGETTEICKFLHSVISDIQGGKISQDTIDTLLLAFRHDADMENALREGEVKGRNAKIDEWKEQQRGMAGIHQLGNASSTCHAHVSPARIGGLSAVDRQTIWERGNEKRVRY